MVARAAKGSTRDARARAWAALAAAALVGAGLAGAGCSLATARSTPRWAGADGVARCDSLLVPAVDAGISGVLVATAIGRFALTSDTTDTEVPTAALVAGSAALASAIYGVIVVRRCQRRADRGPEVGPVAGARVRAQGAQVSATRWPLFAGSERPTTK